MPEMHFVARWPDGERVVYYSPSLVVRDYLQPETNYALADFLERCRAALTIASERVRDKYGFACARAASTLAAIEEKARTCADRTNASVRVESHADTVIAGDA